MVNLVHQLFNLFLVLFFLLKIEHGAKYTVPDRAAHAIPLMLILVMMKVMIAPQCFHPFERRIPGMDRIVHAAIQQVAQDKAGKEHKDIGTDGQAHQQEDSRRDDQAWDRRHKKPLFIPGKMRGVTMQGVDEFLCPLTVRYHMKYKAMHQIFEESPEEHTTQESKC